MADDSFQTVKVNSTVPSFIKIITLNHELLLITTEPQLKGEARLGEQE